MSILFQFPIQNLVFGMGLDKYPSFVVDMHQKAAQMFLDDSLHDQRVRSYCAPSYTSGPNQERDNTEKLHRVAKSLAVFCRQQGLLNLVLSRQQCVQFLQSEAISENAAIGIIDWYFTNNDGLIAFDSLLIGFIVAGQGNLSLVAGAPISEHHSDSANLSENVCTCSSILTNESYQSICDCIQTIVTVSQCSIGMGATG